MLLGHAYLIAGTEAAIPAVLALLEKQGVSTKGNPDVYARAYRQFGVDEARELRERARTRAVSGTRRVFIIAASVMTKEAQNALLKTLEEPLANAMFFILVPSPEGLLPTVRSRMERLELSLGGMVPEEIIPAKQFLAAPPEKRLDMLKPLLEKDDDPSETGRASHGAGKRDIGAILDFLSSLERILSKSSTREGLRTIYHARKYIADKGALVKPLLEEVALLVPKM